MIKLLRSFSPEPIAFGTDLSNRKWAGMPGGHYTYFQTADQWVIVMLNYSHLFGCTELSFATASKFKAPTLETVDGLFSFLPDEDLPNDANRATPIFRHVTFLVMQMLLSGVYERIAFHGATPFLDRIYTRLDRLGYFTRSLEKYDFTLIKQGRDIYLQKVHP